MTKNGDNFDTKALVSEERLRVRAEVTAAKETGVKITFLKRTGMFEDLFIQIALEEALAQFAPENVEIVPDRLVPELGSILIKQ